MALLEIKNLHVSVEDHEILKGVNITINAGEVHSMMGPNGSGKSTLAQVLAGRDTFEVTQGQVLYEGRDLLEMDPSLLKRSVHEGFSGGEKKRNEIFQMAVLEPKLAIMDETDSGLDIDALKIVARGVNTLRTPERAIIVVTHYQRLLNYVVPDVVHVLCNGRIVKSGGKELALELEEKGYGWIEGENAGVQVSA